MTHVRRASEAGRPGLRAAAIDQSEAFHREAYPRDYPRRDVAQFGRIGLCLPRRFPGSNRVDLRNLGTIRDNARNLRGSTLDQWQHSLSWAVEAERLLLTQVRDADIDMLIRTPRHGLISTNPPTGRVLIDAELDARIAAIECAFAEFERATNRWDEGGKFVVPDTSFFINHPTRSRRLTLPICLSAGRSRSGSWSRWSSSMSLTV
jgi:hypothetical protein